MTIEELKSTINSWESGLEFPENKQFLEVVVPAGKLHAICKKLKDTKETAFDYLFMLTGIDSGDCFTVVYHIESTSLKHKIAIKAKTASRENTDIDTVCDIWRTAEFQEREAYDLLGINFKNHPDLRRLFLDDNWVGYPLRKDYKDDEKLIVR
jgi:NADH/F420H2 dehydrogenase subunit C